MNRIVTYREITIAIGILVAMVIAFTLWTRRPGEMVSRSDSKVSLPVAARYLLEPVIGAFTGPINVK